MAEGVHEAAENLASINVNFSWLPHHTYSIKGADTDLAEDFVDFFKRLGRTVDCSCHMAETIAFKSEPCRCNITALVVNNLPQGCQIVVARGDEAIFTLT